MDEEFRSPSPPRGYGVDITGSCPLGRENCTPCRNVSLSSQVIPMSAASKFPSASCIFACIAGRGLAVGVGGPYGCVAAGDEPYSFTIVVRSARALSLNMFSVQYTTVGTPFVSG